MATQLTHPIPLPWQQQRWQQLQQQRLADRLPHALLLTGITGVGQRHFAEALALALLCDSVDSATGYGCGHCRSCRMVTSDNHPDLRYLEPEEVGRPIRIDAVREAIGWLQLTRHQSQYRVLIIEPADSLNTAAANALLKTLEEPVAGTHLLLCSSQPARLPATIRSRCQQLPFSGQDDPLATQQWLQQQLTAAGQPQSDEALQTLLARCGGAPLQAVALPPLESERQRTFKQWRQLRDAGDAVALAQLWEVAEPARGDPEAAQADDLALRRLDWLYEWLLDLARLQLVPTAPLLHPDLIAALQPLAATTAARWLLPFAQQVATARQQLRFSQRNRLLLLEQLLLEWVTRPQQLAVTNRGGR